MWAKAVMKKCGQKVVNKKLKEKIMKKLQTKFGIKRMVSTCAQKVWIKVTNISCEHELWT